ncbi:hypothetical protein os1_08830 [Comamonadaceae bacterium OS-1]|nr:hypothetical protein os1_08830 [Comamonadaceae bacterium OS-1]
MSMPSECSCCKALSLAAWWSIARETWDAVVTLLASIPQKSMDAAAKPCIGSASIISHSSKVRKRNIESLFYKNFKQKK